MTVVAVVLVVGGCGRIAFDPRSDGSASDDTGSGFAPPTVVGELSSADEDDDPTLTADALEVYFVSTRAGGQGMGDIWRSVRSTVDDPWSPPSLARLEAAKAALSGVPHVSAFSVLAISSI